MRIYIETVKAEKDYVKGLGAKWDPQFFAWYFEDSVPDELKNKVRTYLSTTYNDRIEVKAAGAKWDPKQKKWYCVGEITDALKKWKIKENTADIKNTLEEPSALLNEESNTADVVIENTKIGCFEILPKDDPIIPKFDLAETILDEDKEIKQIQIEAEQYAGTENEGILSEKHKKLLDIQEQKLNDLMQGLNEATGNYAIAAAIVNDGSEFWPICESEYNTIYASSKNTRLCYPETTVCVAIFTDNTRKRTKGLFSHCITIPEKYAGESWLLVRLLTINKELLKLSASVRNEVIYEEYFRVDIASISQKKENLLWNKVPERIRAKFSGIIGMEEVKAKIGEFYANIEIAREDAKYAVSSPDSSSSGYHFVLYGSPGTGKTTVAKILGEVLYDLGIRKSAEVELKDAGDLISEYINMTAVQTKDILDHVLQNGGTLFIDEAYGLFKEGNNNDHGIEAINTLLKHMEDNRSGYSVIMAGYEEQMKNMLLKANPGFKSRFRYHITISDFSNEELLEIADVMAIEKGRYLTQAAKEMLIRVLEQERKKPSFANARTVRELISGAIEKHNSRRFLEKNDDKIANYLLVPEDFDDGILGQDDVESVKEKGLEELLEELDSLTGLAKVKEQIHKILDSRAANELKEKMGIKVQKNPNLNMIFMGNPGTGKTTVARLVGQIYRAAGILSSGHYKETSREELVGKYSGHTAPKVASVVKMSLGGVLFIDEAYSLYRDDKDSFGKEAIDTLVKATEDYRDDFCVILAGYTGDMNRFLDANAGLRSRFPNQIDFENYNIDELMEIFRSMADAREFIYNEEICAEVKRQLEQEMNEKDFGNARAVRNLVERISLNMDRRIAQRARESKNAHSISKEFMLTVTFEDVLD